MNGHDGGDDGIDIELSRRKALAALGSIGVASAGAGLGTSAYFSDQETFENNALAAGTLDMGVGYTAHYSDWSEDEGDGVDVRMYDGAAGTTGTAGELPTVDGTTYTGLPANDAWLIAVDDPEAFLDNTRTGAYPNDGSEENPVQGAVTCTDGTATPQANDATAPVIELDDVKPGDFGEVTFDFVLCDNPGYVWVNGSLRSADENGVTEPEADDSDEGAGVELLDVVQAAVWIDDGGDGPGGNEDGNNYQNGGEEPLVVGSLRDVLGMDASVNGTALNGDLTAEEGGGMSERNCFSADTTHSVVFAWWVPVDHGNEIQSDTATFDLSLYTEQCRHNDGEGMGRLVFETRYESGIFDEGGAEIPTFDPASGDVYVINADAGLVDVLDLSANSPLSLTKADELDPTGDLGGSFTDGSVNSVDASDGLVAVAVENENPRADGRVALYDTSDNSFAGSAPLGPLPDLVEFTPDGDTVLVANEGEPASDYSEDPRGSVSVVDISGGPGSASSTSAGFGGFDAASLRSEGVRIFGPGATAAQDLEPESVVAGPDSETAYVSLQENNAIGIVDISDTSNPSVTDVVPLGYKDHSLPGNELDAVEDGTIDIRNEPLFGMYQPDVLETYRADGETYLVTASEGDAREYEGLFETGILTDTGGGDFTIVIDDEDIAGGSDTANVDVDESAFSSGVLSRLEGLEVTARPPGSGDSDPGTVSELYLFGGRSYLILDSDGNQVFESGDQFEQIVRNSDDVPDQQFNADDNENNDADEDSESSASGPEPEGVATGEIDGDTFAFVGFEEVGGIAMFDVTDPDAPTFVDYINTRDFDVDPETAIEDNNQPASVAGDLAPEGLKFVPAAESPSGDPLLIVGYEVSGTTAVYSIA
jgi:predicted ribosomally synthesized peptide with SipW-like signal peptide